MIAAALGLPFRALSAVRSARAFHPDGVQFDGALVRLVPEKSGLPLRTCDVTVRVSKGIGVPFGLPDVAGVALRLPAAEQDGRPWDVLLAGSAAGPVGRMVPWPSMSWNSAQLSSLMPFEYRGRLWWLRARITRPAIEGMSIDDIRTAVEQGTVSIVIEHAGKLGAFEPIAVVHSTILTPPENEIDAFDPLLNSPNEVRAQPEWLRALRLSAYRHSRTGRHGHDHTDNWGGVALMGLRRR